jgi:hypothetical protein
MSEGKYAVIGVWSMDASRWEEQQRVLHEQLVPMVSQSPGFVAGYWMADRSASKTYTTIVFEEVAAAEGFQAFLSGDEARTNQEQGGGEQRIAHGC